MRPLKKSAARNLLVFMADSTDHVSGKEGLTLTITASKAGAAFASISPAVTERSNGWYQLALTSSHTDTIGDFALHISGSGADPADVLMDVVSHDLSTIGRNAFIATDLAIGTVTSQTEFVLTGGPTNDVANVMAIFADTSESGAPVVAEGSYVGSTGTLTLTAVTPITVTTSDTVTLVAVAATGSVTLADGSITAATFGASAITSTVVADGFITAAKIATDAITDAKVAADVVTAIQSGLATAANLATVASYLDTEIAAILADTNELQADWVDGGRLDLLIDALTASLATVKKVDQRVRHTLNAKSGTAGEAGAYDETTETVV